MEWEDKPVKYLRDKTIEQLKFNLANDHLEIVEFEQMVKTALTTTSKRELASLTSDLPKMDLVPRKEQENEMALYNEQEKVTCVMSETRINGIWTPSKQIRLTCVMGDAELDFRDVDLASDVTYVALTCVMGEVRLKVPRGVNVISKVRSFMASAKNGSRGRFDPARPTLMVEGKVVMGEFKIIEAD